MPKTSHSNHSGPAPPQACMTGRRSDAGSVQFTPRDITGLMLTGDMYGAPYDLLATALGVKAARLRGITCRWRKAGLAQTGRIGPGPAWCWLTPAGMRAAGMRFPARRPPLARLAHIRAVLAARLSLEASEEFGAGAAWWRSERRLRSAAGTTIGHVPDAEVHWPDEPGSPFPGEVWAVEAELTPKGSIRTTAIMTTLLAKTGGPAPAYDHIVYLCAPPALPGVHRAATTLGAGDWIGVHDLPEGALL
jgi:hypothetical protein